MDTCLICGNLKVKRIITKPNPGTVGEMLHNLAVAKGDVEKFEPIEIIECPFNDCDWHSKVMRLQYEASITVSLRIKCLILEEIDNILLKSPITVEWLESQWNMKTPEGAAGFLQFDCVKYYPDGFSGLYWIIVDDPMNERYIPKKLQPVTRQDVNKLFAQLDIN